MTSRPLRPAPQTLVTRVGPLMPAVVERLRDEHDAVALEDLPDDTSSVEVAVTSARGGLHAREMDRLPGLRAIVHFGVGYDSTDVAEASRRGIALSNTPDVLTDCVADTAVGWSSTCCGGSRRPTGSCVAATGPPARRFR